MTTIPTHPSPGAEFGASPRAALLARLLDPAEVVMFDGAMGTMLYAKGVFINQCYDCLLYTSDAADE